MPKKYPPKAIIRARELRREMTPAERAMWAILREQFPHHRFRKQVPLLRYIVDFASHRARLVIEIDGGQHGGPEDAARDAALAGEGYRVVRYWNNEVLENGAGVAEALQSQLG